MKVDAMQEKLVAFLLDNPGAKRGDIKAGVPEFADRDDTTIYRYIERAIESGQIQREGQFKGARYYVRPQVSFGQEIDRAVADVVKHGQTYAFDRSPADARPELIALVEERLQLLSPANIHQYGISAEEFGAWTAKQATAIPEEFIGEDFGYEVPRNAPSMGMGG